MFYKIIFFGLKSEISRHNKIRFGKVLNYATLPSLISENVNIFFD